MFELQIFTDNGTTSRWESPDSPMSRREAYRMAYWYRTNASNVKRTRVRRIEPSNVKAV